MFHLYKLPSLLLLLSTLLTTTTALPTRDNGGGGECRPPRNQNQGNNYNPQQTNCAFNPPPILPSSSLTAPNGAFQLKHIVLGKGTQNYTCANSSSAPVAAGAVATLYDISCLSALSADSRTQFASTILPTLLSLPAANMPIPATLSVGTHYFRDGTTAYFGLNGGDFINAGKVEGCAAPAAATGNENGAAVDWLKLVRKEGESSGGVEEVYRVNTAGGRAPKTCGTEGVMTVEYVTEYWMYG